MAEPAQPTDDLLDEHTVIGYLGSRGLIDAATAQASALGGGISNVVLEVTDADHAVVVKQSLERLRVADEWTAPLARVLTEADALTIAAGLTPGSVPRVLDRDEGRHTIVLEHAPPGCRDWKRQLLAGRIDDRVAGELGRVLGIWHSKTTDVASLSEAFRDPEPFELLRVDPYYRTTARRAPEIAAAVLELIEVMERRRTCLVHGDFSPKNVLAPMSGEGGPVWVIDFEVAHYGDPAFDLAFLLTHLVLKSLHDPGRVAHLDGCARTFAGSYTTYAEPALQPDWQHVLRHLACLLLARVRGKSPAEYLTASQRDGAWQLGLSLLSGAPDALAELFVHRDAVLR